MKINDDSIPITDSITNINIIITNVDDSITNIKYCTTMLFFKILDVDNHISKIPCAILYLYGALYNTDYNKIN